MIDLHVHSTFSDGSFTPTELVTMAKKAGLTAMALTDHDTTGGIAEFLREAEKDELIRIPGVEISAEVQKGTMHILGYFINYTDPELENTLVQIRSGREVRNKQILKKLNDLGFVLSWDEVASFAGEEVVGRPHFAQAMMKKGYVSSTAQAFNRYLKKGKPAYANRFRFSPEDSIKAIRAAGGVPVLAHPLTLELDSASLKKYMAELKEIGLQGVEVYYSEHSREQVKEYLELAQELGLIATGGSDFHGSINPGIRLGVGFGNLRVPDEAVDGLKKISVWKSW
jgi:3',5'-nucleoside bisphosphate phosphatase